jgi:hypothetical protein
MSTLSDIVSALREVLALTDDVKRSAATLKEMAQELREHDRRITRLEAQWDTAMRFTGGSSEPPRLKS